MFATPNLGGKWANLVPDSWNQRQINQLAKASDFLEFLNKDWIDFEVKKHFYIKYLLAENDQAVEAVSATNNYEDNNYERISRADHRGIIKPKSPEDDSFKILKVFLEYEGINRRRVISHKGNARRHLRIAMALNGNIPYVVSIRDGFKNSLEAVIEHRFITYLEFIGKSTPSDRKEWEYNKNGILNLIRGFGGKPPDYFVTIGTAVSEAAVKCLSNGHKIIFLGVTNPTESGLINDDWESGGGFIAGVPYGLPIRENLETINKIFPERKPVYIYSSQPENYPPQDSYLKEEIENRNYHPHEILLHDLKQVGEFNCTCDNPVFFGRLFLCNNMTKFSGINSRSPIVGVSSKNIDLGAVVTIGYEPYEIGEIGAKNILLKDLEFPELWIRNKHIEDPPVKIVADRNKLRSLNITIPSDLPFKIEYRGE